MKSRQRIVANYQNRKEDKTGLQRNTPKKRNWCDNIFKLIRDLWK